MFTRQLSRRDLISRGSKLLLAPALAGAVGTFFAYPEDAAAVTLPGLPAVVSSSTGLNSFKTRGYRFGTVAQVVGA